MSFESKGCAVEKSPFRGDLEGFSLKERGPEPRPLLQATILFHLRGHLIRS
jgi:hypothetical protein